MARLRQAPPPPPATDTIPAALFNPDDPAWSTPKKTADWYRANQVPIPIGGILGQHGLGPDDRIARPRHHRAIGDWARARGITTDEHHNDVDHRRLGEMGLT